MSSFSYTVADTQTFTITHARHMAAKVATDLRRMQRMYGYPSDTAIAEYEQEVVVLLKAGFLGTVTYGFQRNENWIEPTLRYTDSDLYGSGADDDPGRIRAGKNVSGASFHSYLAYSTKWQNATTAEREAVKKELPFSRTGASEPGVDGYLENDRTYSAGGRALNRSVVRSY